MGCNIEVSMNLLKNTDIVQNEKNMCNIAQYYNVNKIYNFIDEFYKVIIFNFNKEQYDNIVLFLKSIKKIKNMNIDCVYTDMGNIIYASSMYLKMADKYKSYEYRNKDRNINSEKSKDIIEIIQTGIQNSIKIKN